MTHAFQRKLGAFALAAVLLAVPAAWSAGQVTGKYIGNGKPAKLAYVVVLPHEPWQGEKAYTIILAEKNPAGVEKPDFDAMFGKLGDALVLSVTGKGDIFSTQVCHQALKRSGFSTSGTVYVDNFKLEGKQLSGRFYTKEKESFFDDSWEADLNVKATVP
ncbi:MAG TPA: hypothetical protein VGX68_19455 [Thermoanaerobaculia bacterium]|jgi:hypothetical protein|nr:hypothetical protein [Thermoanaerobaculia bacterium]